MDSVVFWFVSLYLSGILFQIKNIKVFSPFPFFVTDKIQLVLTSESSWDLKMEQMFYVVLGHFEERNIPSEKHTEKTRKIFVNK